jgi:hypothetical protein
MRKSDYASEFGCDLQVRGPRNSSMRSIPQATASLALAVQYSTVSAAGRIAPCLSGFIVGDGSVVQIHYLTKSRMLRDFTTRKQAHNATQAPSQYLLRHPLIL